MSRNNCIRHEIATKMQADHSGGVGRQVSKLLFVPRDPRLVFVLGERRCENYQS